MQTSRKSNKAIGSSRQLTEPRKAMPKKGGKDKAPKASDLGTLVQGALSGEVNTVKTVLKRGLPVESQDAGGNHALGAACCGGNIAVVQLLLDAGAPLELKNGIGTTPLWLAAGYGHLDVLNLLIEKGCDSGGAGGRRQLRRRPRRRSVLYR